MVLKYLMITVFITSTFLVASSQPNNVLPPKLKSTIALKTPGGTTGQANGINAEKITVVIDSSLKINPNFVHLAIDFTQLSGSNQMDILNGRHMFWVFDKAGKEIKIPLKVLTSVKAVLENNSTVELKVRIPFKLKVDKNLYTVHYRWESKDKTRNIDLLSVK